MVPTMEKQTSWLKRLHLGLKKKSRLCRRQISGSRVLKAQGVFGFWECCLLFFVCFYRLSLRILRPLIEHGIGQRGKASWVSCSPRHRNQKILCTCPGCCR